MAERDDLKLKLRAAAEPACDRGRERRQKGVHARDATEAKQKTPVFSALSEFSAGRRRVIVRLRRSSRTVPGERVPSAAGRRPSATR